MAHHKMCDSVNYKKVLKYRIFLIFVVALLLKKGIIIERLQGYGRLLAH